MDLTTEPAGHVPAIGLYRRAVAMMRQARERAVQHEQSGRHERRLREVDAVIETIILTQAAAEGWIHAAYRLADVEPPAAGWIARWADAPSRIVGAAARTLDDASRETLAWLSAWRNYLVHDDERARARLAAYVMPGTELAELTAALATDVIRRMDEAFTDIGAIIGYRTLPALHSDYLWVAADEV